MVGFWIFAIIALICATIMFGIYMYLCSENGTGMFEAPGYKYDKRLKNLEQKIEQLMEVTK